MRAAKHAAGAVLALGGLGVLLALALDATASTFTGYLGAGLGFVVLAAVGVAGYYVMR